MNMRTIVGAAVWASMIVSALAQTQPTRPSAYPTFPTLPSFNPTSPCYSGTPYLSYSATEPFEFPGPNRTALPGSESLDEDQAKMRIEAKGYLDVSGLEKDSRGIWRGQATMKDGRRVDVTLDLEGNIYSEWRSRLYIRIRPPPPK
jgi:hypothetical protein